MADRKEGMKLLITFAERGHGSEISKIYAQNQVYCNYQSIGRGTASSELLDVLGVGTTERDILISMGTDSSVNKLMQRLDDDLGDKINTNGIAFDMPLTGMSNLMAAALLKKSQGDAGNGGTIMDQSGNNSLVLVVVNQGHTDDVMDTARGAGARGGTIIRSRWAGHTDDSQHFYGISLQEEKEIIAIVTSAESRNAIMEMINKKHGIKTEAGAMVCSVAIENMVKL